MIFFFRWLVYWSEIFVTTKKNNNNKNPLRISVLSRYTPFAFYIGVYRYITHTHTHIVIIILCTYRIDVRQWISCTGLGRSVAFVSETSSAIIIQNDIADLHCAFLANGRAHRYPSYRYMSYMRWWWRRSLSVPVSGGPPGRSAGIACKKNSGKNDPKNNIIFKNFFFLLFRLKRLFFS